VSYAIDVNVLLYASDRSSDRHGAALAFLESCAANRDVLCLPWPVLMSYLRIATHPSVFAAPLAPREAIGNVAALLALPRARPIAEMDGFLDTYQHVSGGAAIRGNLVPDAHLAAILLQHGVRTLYSNDRDFRKFAPLDVRDPFAESRDVE
jgi:uncharacterized protein